MFIGHFGVGFAARQVVRRCSLGTLFLAAQWIDLIWPILLLFGIERVAIEPGNTAFTPLNFTYYPFTHSLFGVLIWAVLFGAVYFVLKRNFKTSLLLAFLVTSHWLLDLIVHRPDLPLDFSGGHKVGLGLWNSIPWTIIVEGAIFLGGAAIYAVSTQASDRVGRFGLIGLVAFLTLVYVANILGPPPESATAIGIVGLAQWLIVFWAYWIDRHRESQAQD